MFSGSDANSINLNKIYKKYQNNIYRYNKCEQNVVVRDFK